MAVRVVCRGAWLARETRASVLHAKHAAHWGENLCTGPRRTSNAAWGLLLSTIGHHHFLYSVEYTRHVHRRQHWAVGKRMMHVQRVLM